MSLTKFSHEYKLVDNAYRKLDPIGKMSFNEQVVATKEGNVHTIDLEKSSNFLVKIDNENSWIKFVNYDSSKILRFDLVIHITGNVTVQSIKFGDGTKEYYQPQIDQGDPEQINRILPYVFWPYNSIPIRAALRSKGEITVLTVRYGYNLLGAKLVPAFNIVSYKWITEKYSDISINI